MNPVAWGRLILAGAGAGLVYNVGGLLSAWLSALPESFARFGVAPSASAALLHLSLRLGLGLASVLLYTGVRHSWGPGLTSAWRVGLLVWFAGYVPGSVVLHEVGVLTDGQLAFALPWGVVESVAATCVGAWLCREEQDVAGIVRVFHAEAKAGMEEEFQSFFVDQALPLVQAQHGILSVSVGLPQTRTPRSFLMISTWSGLDALQEFAGEEWTEAVVDPREEHLLESVSVSHYVGLHVSEWTR